MQSRHAKRFVGQIDAGDLGAVVGHGFGENAAAAADVEHRLPCKLTALAGDVTQPQRIDVVQRFEFAGRIPPMVRERAELGELRRVGVDVHWRRSCQNRARDASSLPSNCVSVPSARSRSPATPHIAYLMRPVT